MADEAVVAQTQDDVSTTTDTTKTSETTTPNPTKTESTTRRPDPAQGTKGGDDIERRFKGIQADLAKERKARQQFERDLAAARAEVESERRRVAALAGINTPSPEDAEAEAIRAQFKKVFTREQLLEAMGLTPDEIEAFRESAKTGGVAAEAALQQERRYAQKMVDAATAEIKKEYGELTPRAVDAITRAYVARASETDAEGQLTPEAQKFLARHEAGDPTLAVEFAKDWLADWYEPAKRRATAAEVGRFPRVPSGQGRGTAMVGEKKIDVKNDKAVEDLLVAGFRERGGQFKR